MRSNPGGQIPVSEIIGRDKIVSRLWKILERQSLLLTAERRMGKTHIVKKMMSAIPDGILAIPGNSTPRDLEKVHTCLEFVETVFFDVEDYLSRFKRTAQKARRLLAQVSGAEFEGFKFPELTAPHWKTLLTETIGDLMTKQSRLVLFFWDEMPLMLFNIKEREGEHAAMEVLDTLRSLRQSHPHIRMVFTGSIGLHLLIASLRRSRYANDPTNDMYIMDVEPLEFDDAVSLAMLLLRGENITGADLDKTAREIAVAVDGIPHYIHHVVDQITNLGGKITPDIVERVVSTCLTDSNDRWHMSYYRDRLDTYYEVAEREFALRILDVLCISKKGVSFRELFNLVKSQIITEDAEAVRNVLTKLRRDHYVAQDANGQYHFLFPLIQRSWRIQRGL
jgi:hypothetical protein